MRKFTLFAMLVLCSFMHKLQAQSDRAADSLAIIKIIDDVFEGMRKGDSAMISKHLLPEVIMHSVGLGPNEQTKIFTDSKPAAWLQAVAQPKAQMWDERTINYKLNLTEGLATIWMDYAFFIDEQFSHCGVNSFQLVKSMGKWKIIYIIDTRKKENCNISAFLDTNN